VCQDATFPFARHITNCYFVETGVPECGNGPATWLPDVCYSIPCGSD
jgi:hypothetical protein